MYYNRPSQRFIISSTGTPTKAAVDAAAALVECAEKPRTPAALRAAFIHLPIKAAETALYGFTPMMIKHYPERP